MLQSKPINFDLLANAKDSLRQAVELMAWKEVGDDHGRLKHAIGHAAHAVELLLKERLRRTNGALIWENVDKYPSLEARTVTVDKAVSRLKKIARITITDQDFDQLRSLRRTRNAIEHYEWETTEREARLIIGNALSFAFSFAQEHLEIDLSEDFRSDDTWRVLIDDLREFADAHGRRIEKKMQESGTPTTYCEECETPTVPIFGGSCELCGHWQEEDDG